MLHIFYWLMHTIQPFLVPICFVLAWAFTLLTVWSIGSLVFSGVSRARQMHRIPCADCQYFTGDYTLKCTVHPSIALSEEAIDCSDYAPTARFF
ncbi:MAG: hypothetical protein HC780_16805 [Leptolyngbyaceae cyanobacterium CSU_1_3]|nr:hypothetical protein [Leptolyngbyaceae cyanobacterium CSU_1_3]